MAAQHEFDFAPMRMGKIHAAKLQNSPRLERVLTVLQGWKDGWVGTRHIIQWANVCAVNSAIAELRANGIAIESRCVGRGLYEYRLTK